MALYMYAFDGSSLSFDDRDKLITILDKYAHHGVLFVDLKKGLYQAAFEETVDIATFPLPAGTIVKRVYQ